MKKLQNLLFKKPKILNIFVFSLLFIFSIAYAQSCPSWDKTQAKSEYASLNSQLQKANEQYRQTGKSFLSDAQYDYLKDKLDFWRTCFDYLPRNAKADKLVAGRSEHKAVHTGMQKAKSEEQVQEFLKNNSKLWLMPKIDGMALTLEYDKGKLVRAITRGDGKFGEDITQNILLLENIPKTIADKTEVIVQGELFWRHKNRSEKQEDASKRELVVGFAMQKNALAFSKNQEQNSQENLEENPLKNIDFFAWEVPSLNASFTDKIIFLDNLGFTYIKKYSYLVEDFAQIKQLRASFFNQQFEFATDGVVLNADIIPNFQNWKVGNKYWSLAWKYENKTGMAKITSINFTIGRTGKVTPVASFDATEIAGRIYENVSVGSLQKLRELNLQVGDLVELELGGGIIPKITKNVLPINNAKIKIADFSNYSYTSCMNYSKICQEQFIARLDYMGKKLKIKNVGKSTWRLMAQNHLIESLLDWQNLNVRKIARVKAISEDKAGKIALAFSTAKKADFINLLVALGVPANSKHLYKCKTQLYLKPSIKVWKEVNLTAWQSCGFSLNKSQKLSKYLLALHKSL